MALWTASARGPIRGGAARGGTRSRRSAIEPHRPGAPPPSGIGTTSSNVAMPSANCSTAAASSACNAQPHRAGQGGTHAREPQRPRGQRRHRQQAVVELHRGDILEPVRTNGLSARSRPARSCRPSAETCCRSARHAARRQTRPRRSSAPTSAIIASAARRQPVSVTPAYAGVRASDGAIGPWIPAFAGMRKRRKLATGRARSTASAP